MPGQPDLAVTDYDERECAQDAIARLIGDSEPMAQLRRQILRVAPTDATVLILGESGTGKEMVAQTLHEQSARALGPFIPVNCGAIAPNLIEAELLGHERGSFTGAERQRAGYFERAHGGTIFLDEVTEMPLEMQVKLLRVLESRSFQRVGGTQSVQVDVRVIAATNRELDSAVNEGRFREDLLYRLAVFPLRVPPLRERGGDVVQLAQHLLAELNAREGARKVFSRKALGELALHSWPGNVRELKNAVTRAFILSDQSVEFRLAAMSSRSRRLTVQDGCLQIGVGVTLAEAQRELILATLDHFSGDKRRTAEALGVSLKTLYNRLESYRNLRSTENEAA